MTREEAINTVRNIYQTDKEKEALEILIPELVESEDERMLREIKRYIKEQGDKPTGLPNGTVAISDMIAWLEKQKEQKQEKFPPYVTGFKGDPDPAGVWKPSEEQMVALFDIIHPADTVNRSALESLYEQLKKLM